MSSRQKVVLAVCLGIAVMCLGYLGKRDSDEATRYSTSTYSAGPWGCKALFQVLEELQLPVTRFRQSFRRLQSHKGVLVITGPLRAPIAQREKAAIRKWIEAGNQLVVCDGPLTGPFAKVKGTGDTPKRGALPLPGMSSPSGFLNLRLKESADSTRKTFVVPLPDLDAAARISVAGGGRWRDPPKEWSTLIKDEAGPVLIARERGKGRVFALSDATLASNKHVGEEQNLRLILALILARSKPQEILFDEFHQGHAAEQTLWSFFGSSILAWVFLQGALVLVLFFFSSRAQYAGRYRSLASPTGRSSLEYVDSMAGVYESCKAGSVALEALLNRFLARLSRRTGMPLKRLIETSPERIAALAPNGQEDLAVLIEQCRVAVKAGQQPPRALALAKQLALARQSIRGFDQIEKQRR
jgi:hypothetical protein